MLTASGANFGYSGALPQILAINVGGFIQTIVTCLGLGTLVAGHPAAQMLLRVASALYLIYLATRLAGATVGEGRAPQPFSFVHGAMFQAFNPKSWVKIVP